MENNIQQNVQQQQQQQQQQQIYQQQRRDKKYYAVVIMLLLIIGLSVGYAVLSVSFNITGSSIIKDDAQWLVELKSSTLSESVTCLNDAKCTFTTAANAASLQPDDGVAQDSKGAIIWNSGNDVFFKHYLTGPGKSFSFTVAYKNKGTMDAVIANREIQNFTSTAATYLQYSVVYGAGTKNADGSTLYAEDTAVEVGQDLPAGATAVFKVTVTYKEINDPANLPNSTDIAAINNVVNEIPQGSPTLFTVQYEQK